LSFNLFARRPIQTRRLRSFRPSHILRCQRRRLIGRQLPPLLDPLHYLLPLQISEGLPLPGLIDRLLLLHGEFLRNNVHALLQGLVRQVAGAVSLHQLERIKWHYS
jgi:hypothetical protein